MRIENRESIGLCDQKDQGSGHEDDCLVSNSARENVSEHVQDTRETRGGSYPNVHKRTAECCEPDGAMTFVLWTSR